MDQDRAQRKKEKSRQYYLKNREKALAKAKEQYHRDPEARKAAARAWEARQRAENLEEYRAKKSANQQARREADPEGYKREIREGEARRHARNPLDRMNRHLKYHYGLTVEQYQAMVEAQGNRCKICERGPEETGSKRLCVDHDHKTGKVRSLLCHYCNKALGHLEDSVERLQAAIEYLQKSLT
jgi:hypothetical protein